MSDILTGMKKILLICIAVVILASAGPAIQCDSIRDSWSGGWKPVSTAPHDGTPVELLETYGIASWAGLFKWTREHPAQTADVHQSYCDSQGKCVAEEQKPWMAEKPSWVEIDRPGYGVYESGCLFWRPYKGNGTVYVDPTGGRQNSIAYWCAAAHLDYDPKQDRCK